MPMGIIPLGRGWDSVSNWYYKWDIACMKARRLPLWRWNTAIACAQPDPEQEPTRSAHVADASTITRIAARLAGERRGQSSASRASSRGSALEKTLEVLGEAAQVPSGLSLTAGCT